MTLSAVDVLVVDDDRVLADLLTNFLEDEGYVVRVASNGQDALDLVRERPPDMILMDIQMPVMDGYTCCRRLRGVEATARIPIIVMSANAARAAVQAELGIEEFLGKPFDLNELMRRVRKLTLRSGRVQPRT